MVKVLLVFEEYNELSLTEVYLKKVGFDVVGITNELSLADQLLSFNPEIVVAHGKGSRVSSFSVGQKMKENHRYHGKVVIVVPKDVRPGPNEIMKMKMDGILESPIQPEKMIQVLCRLSHHPVDLFLEKFQKAKLDPEIQKKMIMVTGSGAPLTPAATPSAPASASAENVVPLSKAAKIPIQDSERMKKYAQYTEGVEIDIKQSTHQRADVKEAQKELKKSWDSEKLDQQDELKRQFAEALFQKK